MRRNIQRRGYTLKKFIIDEGLYPNFIQGHDEYLKSVTVVETSTGTVYNDHRWTPDIISAMLVERSKAETLLDSNHGEACEVVFVYIDIIIEGVSS